MKNVFVLMLFFVASLAVQANNRSEEDLRPYSVTKTTIKNVSPFCISVVKGDYEMVKKMIELGHNVNEISNDMSPLMYAARYNQTEIIKLLVANGAKVKQKDKRGNTALKYATYANATEALSLLKSL